MSKNNSQRGRNRFVSQRILVLSNVLRRAAALRYRRLLNLGAGEWGVIAELGHQAPRTLNDLSRRIGLDKTQLSRTVARLIARGLVLRKPNPRDNREVRLSLSRAGQDCHAQIMQAGRRANLSLLAELSAAERQQLVDLIERVTARARALLRAEQDL